MLLQCHFLGEISLHLTAGIKISLVQLPSYREHSAVILQLSAFDKRFKVCYLCLHFPWVSVDTLCYFWDCFLIPAVQGLCCPAVPQPKVTGSQGCCLLIVLDSWSSVSTEALIHLSSCYRVVIQLPDDKQQGLHIWCSYNLSAKVTVCAGSCLSCLQNKEN